MGACCPTNRLLVSPKLRGPAAGLGFVSSTPPGDGGGLFRVRCPTPTPHRPGRVSSGVLGYPRPPVPARAPSPIRGGPPLPRREGEAPRQKEGSGPRKAEALWLYMYPSGPFVPRWPADRP
jgi:hypothetical protein